MVMSLLVLSSIMFHNIERPALVTSTGMTESGMNPKAKGRAGERGAYQVIEKDWGKVPKSLPAQSLQNEKILDELLHSHHGNYKKAVASYNGSGPKARRYANLVLKRAVRIHLLGVKEA